MRQLRINPKEKGTIVEFGKLPIFTRSLTKKADMDNVVQIKVEGGYYAIERRPSPNPLEEALKKLAEKVDSGYVTAEISEIPEEEVKEEQQPAEEEKFVPFKTHYQVGRDRFNRLKELEKSGALAECKNRLDICEKMGFEPKNGGTGYNWLSNQVKKGFLEERLVRYNKQNSGEYEYRLTGLEPNYSGNKNIQEKAKPKTVKKDNSLENLGFVNLSGDSKPAVKKERQTDYLGRPIEQGNLSLFEWLKSTDYLVYKLFVYGNGQVSLNKVVDYDDICLVFLEAGLPDKRGRDMRSKGRSAQNVANMTVARLLAKGVLEKSESGEQKYCLTFPRGSAYARAVYQTISAKTYDWIPKKGRTLRGFTD